FLAEKIWIINESVSYFNEFRPLDCFVATLLATTVPKIVPYRATKQTRIIRKPFYFVALLPQELYTGNSVTLPTMSLS
ncbi:hypothetical protein SC460_12060, partial [Legionella pneumophila serogroup 1]|nr:hypothetical protein [Legionella pneumophila]MDW9162116.1 hypothetical protein [Legionella pneumophila]